MSIEYDRGRLALVYFHNEARKFSNYKISLDELIAILKKRGPKTFVEGLGDGIIIAEINEKNVASGMQTLARNGKGKIPATNGAFTQAVANDVRDNISYVDAFIYVAEETTSQVIDESVSQASIVFDYSKFAVGEVYDVAKVVTDKTGTILMTAADSTESILKNAKWIIPALLFFGVGIYVFVYAKGSKVG